MLFRCSGKWLVSTAVVGVGERDTKGHQRTPKDTQGHQRTQKKIPKAQGERKRREQGENDSAPARRRYRARLPRAGRAGQQSQSPRR
jgi:hypothetical protein